MPISKNKQTTIQYIITEARALRDLTHDFKKSVTNLTQAEQIKLAWTLFEDTDALVKKAHDVGIVDLDQMIISGVWINDFNARARGQSFTIRSPEHERVGRGYEDNFVSTLNRAARHLDRYGRSYIANGQPKGYESDYSQAVISQYAP
jgi:hypothetical protein